jgi:hypothetical protein
MRVLFPSDRDRALLLKLAPLLVVVWSGFFYKHLTPSFTQVRIENGELKTAKPSWSEA